MIPTESVDDQGPMPDEIKAITREQKQAEIFYQVAEEGYGLSHEEAQRWFYKVTEELGGRRQAGGPSHFVDWALRTTND